MGGPPLGLRQTECGQRLNREGAIPPLSGCCAKAAKVFLIFFAFFAHFAVSRLRGAHLRAMLDGVRTAQRGEGPWIEGTSSIAPGVLIAGQDPAATDAVATAAMGYDPTAPFLRGDNPLTLARDPGLGTKRPDEIAVVGLAIEEVWVAFAPCWG